MFSSKLVWLLSVIAASLISKSAAAEDCQAPAESGPDDTWFFVEIVTSKDKPLPKNVWRSASVAALPPEQEQYNPAHEVRSCFAAAVPKRSRTIKVKAQAFNYQSRTCNVGQTWRNFSAKKMYKCQLLPVGGGLFDGRGKRRFVDLSPEAQEATIAEATALALAVPGDQRVATLDSLRSVLEVRRGILAQIMLHNVAKGCSRASCIDSLPDTVDGATKEWLRSVRSEVQAEDVRDEQIRLVRAKARNRTLATDLLLILEDPSDIAVIGSDETSKKRFALYINARLPKSRAEALLNLIGDAKDLSAASAKIPKLDRGPKDL